MTAHYSRACSLTKNSQTHRRHNRLTYGKEINLKCEKIQIDKSPSWESYNFFYFEYTSTHMCTHICVSINIHQLSYTIIMQCVQLTQLMFPAGQPNKPNATKIRNTQLRRSAWNDIHTDMSLIVKKKHQDGIFNSSQQTINPPKKVC